MKNVLTSVILLSLNLPFIASAGVINLGSAEDYIFATASNEQWGGNLLLGSEAHIFGSVAASNTLELGDGVIVDGNACAKTTNNWGAIVNGVSTCDSFSQLANDITGAATQAQAFASTELGNITESSAITGSGFQSFNIKDLLLSGGETLTITGGLTDSLVFNVFGQAQLGSGANILLQGGITADNVIFNFVENPVNHSFEIGGANISGTFLSSGRSFILGDGATLNNSRFYSTESIVANVQDVRFPSSSIPSTPIAVPEPSTLVLLLSAMLGLTLRRFKR
ncbi:PEP-CTERM sorting domain-containing protein [Colwellia echini]|uniref:PEP-CTERM sorting domain-containing protein n=1 Tax=Colwellia echini TaxID=1982103 RepID=A0ABY3N058_9GAMM|nr:PEP-CTERM sorting domain-containing protein [Colwellia echini]TYK66860.1 PEP-CTERM sorting domain-containing protein [Colwellia echini]